MVNSRKKLLVLDINGLLLDTYYQGESRPDRPHDAKVNKFYVYKRAFCDEFIQFCLQNFIVGVWSSAREHNVVSLVEFMFKEAKGQLEFIWHQRHCTDTGFKHPENKYKPVFLKELSRLWEKFESGLPWARGDYGPSNTLLIDDSPYKAISNPRHTAIFPKTYKATDPEDNYLAGELLPYLEGLLKAKDVQTYLARNPIGEPSISPSDPQWSQILNSGQFKNEEETIPAHLMAIGGPVRPQPIPSSHQLMMPNNLLPANGGSVPTYAGAQAHSWDAANGGLVPTYAGAQSHSWDAANGGLVPTYAGAQSHSWDAANGDERWRRSDRDRFLQESWNYNGRAYDPQLPRDRIPERNWDNNGGTYAPHGYGPRDQFQSATGPSRSSRHMFRETSDDLVRRHAMLSAARSSDYGDVPRGADFTYNDGFQNYRHYDRRNDSFRDYANRASGWSDEPEDFSRLKSWDVHRSAARDHEGSYHGENTRERRLDGPRDPRGVPMEESRVIQTRDRGREREFEGPYNFPRRASPRQDHRMEESQFRSKSREGRDFQRYSSREQPRKRDLSEDSGRRSQKHDNSNDRSHSRGRTRSGRKVWN